MAKIFLVDDSKFMRNIIADILLKGNHTISGEASNGRDAILNFYKTSSDLLIIDLNLPDIDGIETLRRIKKLNPHVKAIIFSSISHNNYKMESYIAGASDYLVKPFDFNKLLASVESVLKREK